MRRAIVLAAVAGFFLVAPASAQVNLTQEERELLHRLETYLVTMDFQEAPFEDVIEYLRISTNVNMVIDPEIYKEVDPKEMRISLKVRDLPAMNALKLILDISRLSWSLKNGVLLVTTKERRDLRPYVQVYDIRDLMFEIKDFPGPDISLSQGEGDSGIGAVFDDSDSGSGDDLTQPDVIMDIVRENVGTGSWEDGTTGMQVVSGLLVVRQTEEVHREVDRLLDMLRAHK